MKKKSINEFKRTTENKAKSNFASFADISSKSEYLCAFAVKQPKTGKNRKQAKKLCIIKTDIPATYKKH